MDGPALFGDFPGYRGHVSLDGDSAVRGDPGNGFVFAADDPWDTRPGTAEPTSLVGGPPAARQTGRVCAHVLPGPGVTGAEDRRLLGLRGKGRGHRKVRGLGGMYQPPNRPSEGRVPVLTASRRSTPHRAASRPRAAPRFCGNSHRPQR